MVGKGSGMRKIAVWFLIRLLVLMSFSFLLWLLLVLSISLLDLKDGLRRLSRRGYRVVKRRSRKERGDGLLYA